jgi:hypothetical protein
MHVMAAGKRTPPALQTSSPRLSPPSLLTSLHGHHLGVGFKGTYQRESASTIFYISSSITKYLHYRLRLTLAEVILIKIQWQFILVLNGN